jgi:hypothetical protein
VTGAELSKSLMDQFLLMVDFLWEKKAGHKEIDSEKDHVVLGHLQQFSKNGLLFICV